MWWLAILTTLGTVAEVLGIGMVIPFLSLLVIGLSSAVQLYSGCGCKSWGWGSSTSHPAGNARISDRVFAKVSVDELHSFRSGTLSLSASGKAIVTAFQDYLCGTLASTQLRTRQSLKATSSLKQTRSQAIFQSLSLSQLLKHLQ